MISSRQMHAHHERAAEMHHGRAAVAVFDGKVELWCLKMPEMAVFAPSCVGKAAKIATAPFNALSEPDICGSSLHPDGARGIDARRFPAFLSTSADRRNASRLTIGTRGIDGYSRSCMGRIVTLLSGFVIFFRTSVKVINSPKY